MYLSPFIPPIGRVDAFWRVSCVGRMFYRLGCAKGRKGRSRASGAILQAYITRSIDGEGAYLRSAGILPSGR